MTNASLLLTVDHAAADVCTAYGQLEVLSATIRRDGDQLRVIYPDGRYADIARMLYAAADLMADQAQPTIRLKRT